MLRANSTFIFTRVNFTRHEDSTCLTVLSGFGSRTGRNVNICSVFNYSILCTGQVDFQMCIFLNVFVLHINLTYHNKFYLTSTL